MLTRQSISSGAYLDGFDALPRDIRWTPAQIERSLARTLKSRPRSGDVWVFGYGSLIWNPLLNFDRQQWASLHGWHRSFCLRMIAGRASADRPGRMLALEPGGETQGIALRIPAAIADEELRLVWIREMPTGAYRPRWMPITLQDGSQAEAIVFVADPDYPLYEKDASVSAVAPLVVAATGPYGSNADYVRQLDLALTGAGVTDAYVKALAEALERLESPAGS